MWRVDGLTEELEPFIINLEEDDEDDMDDGIDMYESDEVEELEVIYYLS